MPLDNSNPMLDDDDDKAPESGLPVGRKLPSFLPQKIEQVSTSGADFFDEDEVLDYVWYEEMRKEDEGDDGSGKEGCLALFAFLLLPVAGAGVCVPQQRVIAAVTACAAYRSHSLFLAFKIGVAAQAGLVGCHNLTPLLR